MPQRKKYILRVRNTLVEVSAECYKAFYKSRRREKYLAESDEAHGKISYHALGSEDYTGEEIIPDKSATVEDIIIGKLMAEKLRQCLGALPKPECKILTELYYKNKSVRMLSSEMGIPPMTLYDRKAKILAKLKKMMEN